MTNPYYFSGVDDPYMEIWALVDGSGNILMVDQNLFLLKILEAIPYTNIATVERLSTLANFTPFKRHLSNDTCLKFAVAGGVLTKANKDTSQIQDKLFTLRHKLAKIFEQSVSNQFYQSCAESMLLMMMFGNDASTKNIAYAEIDRFSGESEKLQQLINELYELP
jgi:hypothetical protein